MTVPESVFSPSTRRAEAKLLRPDADGDVAGAAAERDAQLVARFDPDAIGSGDGAAEQVRDAEEAGDELRARPVVELGRLAQLLDLTAVHDRDRVGHRHRLLLVVRDVHEGDPQVVLEGLQLELELLAQLQVERAEWLVEEQHLRPVDERPRERHPLLLSSGQLARLARPEVLETDATQDLRDPSLQLGALDPLSAQPERHVLVDRQVREERVALEDGVHVALVRWEADDVLAAEQDRAGIGLLEASDHPQRRRLAAPGRAEQREEGAGRNLERDAVHGRDAVERLDDRLELDVASRRHRSPPR